jgi:hypothetical protein
MDPVSKRDAELVAQGWTRMFTIEASRVEEYVDLYRESGHEVLVETPDGRAAAVTDPQCEGCVDLLESTCCIIYVRKPRS